MRTKADSIRLYVSDGGIRLSESILFSLTFSVFRCFERERRFGSRPWMLRVHLKEEAQPIFEKSYSVQNSEDRQSLKREYYFTFLVGNQLDAQFLIWYIYLNPLHVSSNYVLIFRRTIVLTLRWLMSYIYGAPILDVSRSHTTTQHSR